MARLAPPKRRTTARPDAAALAMRRPGLTSTPFGVPIQAKMAIGPSRDRFEAEADRAADHVTKGAFGTPAITPLGSAPAMRMPQEDEQAQRAVKDESEEVQRQAEEEEETLQLQRAVKDESEEVQRKTDDEEEETVQRKTDDEEEETVQRDGAGRGSTASPSVEAGIRSARGGGAPMPAETQGRMEQGFGRDFSGVRVHTDSRAAGLSNAINARAFTTGSDIFFARGAYTPGTSAGDRLLAHELAHVAQQTSPGLVQSKHIQRDSNPPSQSSSSSDGQSTTTTPPPPMREWTDPRNPKRGIKLDGPGGKKLYRLPKLALPSIARKIKGVDPRGTIQGGFMPGRGGGANPFIPKNSVFHWTGQGERSTVDEQTKEIDDTPQAKLWDKEAATDAQIETMITDRFENTKPKIARGGDGGPRVYYLRHKNADSNRFTLVGTAAEISKMGQAHRPPYAPDGSFTFMQVDHYIEIQLGGAHKMSNMWLLDQSSNGSSGSRIASSVEKDLKELVKDAQPLWDSSGVSKPAIDGWPEDANIDFAEIKRYAVGTAKFWDKSQIQDGSHLDGLRPLNATEMRKGGFNFVAGASPTAITVFNSKTSPFRKRMTHKNGVLRYNRRTSRDDFISGFNLKSATYTTPTEIKEDQKVATLEGKAFGNRTVPIPGGGRTNPIAVSENVKVPVLQTLDSGFGGYINTAEIDRELRAKAKTIAGYSPLSIQSAGLNNQWELFAEATVNPSISLLKDFQFTVRAQGDAIILNVQVPTDKLDFGPFDVTEANISLGYGDDGPVFGGSAAFEIAGVGSGSLQASNQQLSGTFNFDIDAFDPAEIGVTYADGEWSGSVEMGIKPGTIPYVESGTINAGFGENGFSIDGTAALAGPGIPEGTELTIAYSQETGAFTFGGEVPLDTSKFPGLTGARAGFTVTRTEAGEYRVAGDGSAAFELAGITGNVDLAYNNGLLTANGEATVNRPPLTGSANFHMSNQAVDENGQPIEGPPLEEFRVWGGGEASIQFGDYITATTGIQFLENGEIELTGTIALPPSITLIEATEYHYDIFTFPEVRFPIIGFTIPVVGTSFGVFGFVRAGLDANLSLGPGELVDSEVSVTYNPDRPEDMSITGGSTFQIGASADVGLTVTGGVGAGLAVVEATGEIGLRGALGLELSGGAGVTLNWTPADGLSIDASVFGEAQPKFTISVVADARVVVDAVLWSGTLWNESWERELASIGPDATWRAELPASWSERDGLDVDINNLELTYPDIDLGDMAEDVFDAIVSR